MEHRKKAKIKFEFKRIESQFEVKAYAAFLYGCFVFLNMR